MGAFRPTRLIPMTRPRLFVSTVSTELGSARLLAARWLRGHGYDTNIQNDFPTGPDELKAFLREQIDACDGLIQLVGEAYGAEPPQADPAWGRLSYTQYELRHAQAQGMRVWVLVMGAVYPRDVAPDQCDLPPAGWLLDVQAAQAWQAERQVLQADYRAWLKAQNFLRHPVDTPDQLKLALHGLKDELGELRHVEERRQRHLSRTLVAILAGVTVLLGGGWRFCWGGGGGRSMR